VITFFARWYVLAVFALLATALPFTARVEESSAGTAVSIIDTHAHIVRGYRKRGPSPSAFQALAAMDALGVEMTFLLPPPFPEGHPGLYGRPELEAVVRQYPGRFAFLAGGASLNPIIHATPPDKVTPEVMRTFEAEAEAIAEAGAAGFGELTAEHFSSGRGNHPYESTLPDHPLFLRLADIAARRGTPIDLHMEAVPRNMPMPPRFARVSNPEKLKENISGLDRLLGHNRNARIVWAHAGWDNTGERTVQLMRALLERNPNLYMSIKLDPGGPQRTSPLGPDGGIRPDWLALLKDFSGRFVIGSDQFFDEGTERLTRARQFIDALPPDVAHLVARENAKQIYRLPAQAK